MKLLAAVPLLLLVGCASAPPVDRSAAAAEVASVLDGFHDAASRADAAAYFGALAPDAIFIGTDPAERWTLADFRAFADPYFSQGRGWTYRPRDRHIALDASGDTAWFDEMLDNDSYGVTRGTGVLVRVGESWKIAQYHLTIPVPNELSKDVVRMIRERR
ncbi:MAG TPA: nuclear transport factor 2 family protein [Thermoanaerobaculia bacterium]|nr:nuclear transport factor 2 family protein [Thermoanaerobaculia bacterium]